MSLLLYASNTFFSKVCKNNAPHLTMKDVSDIMKKLLSYAISHCVWIVAF